MSETKSARSWGGGLALLALGVAGVLIWRANAPETTDHQDKKSGRPASTVSSTASAAEQPLPPEHVGPSQPAAPSSTGAIELPWGPNGLGRGTSDDGYPSGPNSFAVGPDGSMWIVDQFNNRLVRVGPDGKILETRKSSLESVADVTLGKDGSMAVIDRNKSNAVEVFDPSGRSRGVFSVPEGEPGKSSELTRVFVNEGRVYGQRDEGGPLLWLGGTDGKAAGEGTHEINGQPSRDGRLLLAAGVTDFQTGRVWMSGADPASQAHIFTREYLLDVPLDHILLLDSDLTGVVYFVVKAAFDDENALAFVLCMDGNDRGKLLRSFSLPYPSEPLDTFRKFEVAPNGGLIAAEYTESGMGLRTHLCR